MESVIRAAQAAKGAKHKMASLSTQQKNDILVAMGNGLLEQSGNILAENARDVELAREKGRTETLIDRLTLTQERIEAMAQGLFDIAGLTDPVGEVLHGEKRPNGLLVKKVRVPMGVIGIIYEARPNVTADAAGLCLKAGNAVVLKGSSEAMNSNIAVTDAMVQAGQAAGLPQGAVSLVRDASREAAAYLMTLNEYVDVLIPRGGAGLIKTVVENATLPVIETGTGNCHIYVDKSADFDMAAEITVNAKVSRPSVCNAAESLLVHADIAGEFLPKAFALLQEKGVELRGDEVAQQYGAKPAAEEDYYTEYLDYIMSVKVVDGLDDAIAHINQYSTGHSEAIITNDYTSAKRFQNEVDSAAVYVNASTRYTDGFEFGFGAEIGISTQKLHARGPMGLPELTTVKYIIDGDGQVRW
ncbi:glutamate-5-semialdehyde dehydrogenase [Christensenellaceae bacterium OttesenSCG-928-K19]|nr:glutamate-5-semialdehyde dehydrogenase [Christensenellaceae bacterium OttesenSCG-928-K19]